MARSARRTARSAWLAAALLTASSAWANGRFPRSQQVVEDPRDPGHLYLAGTYGLLRTTNRGRDWHFVCEQAFANNSLYADDPLLAFGNDGTLFVDVQVSLNASTDDGCGFAPVLGGGTDRVVDFTIARSSGAVLAVVASYEARVAFRLYESANEGRTWSPAGVPLPADAIFTVDVAPQDPTRVYATGLAGQTGQLLVSNDRGASWTSHAIAGADAGHIPYIAAVDANHPGRIYVRTSGTVPDTVPLASDSLLYSEDDGATFRELLTNGARLLGFALAPDGSTVLLGYGDPGDGAKVSGGVGVYRSPTDGFSFTRVLEANVSCLSWTQTGVYVCASRDQTIADLYLAPDGDLGEEGACLTRLLKLGDVRGPVACEPAATTCASSWSNVCQVIGACGDAGAPGGDGGLTVCAPAPPDAAPTDASGPDESAPEASDADHVDVGRDQDEVRRDVDTDGTRGETADADAGVAAPTDGASSCACTLARGGSAPPAPSAPAAILAFLGLARRRRPHA